MTQAEIDILAEREKQRAKWDTGHDDEHDDGQLAKAAGAMALNVHNPASNWWGYALTLKHTGNRRKQLVIAAALLIAEVERIDRATLPQPEPGYRLHYSACDCRGAGRETGTCPDCGSIPF